MRIHECISRFEEKTIVNCVRTFFNFTLTGKIILLKEGYIFDNLLLGIVTDDRKDEI